jgi:hypothetical protein
MFRHGFPFVAARSGNHGLGRPEMLGPCRVKFRSVLGDCDLVRFGMIPVCGFLQPVRLGIRASGHPSKV